MTRKRKNSFLTFCWSLIPGAGEMYLGFMKMGLSIMVLFWVLVMILNVLYINIVGYMIFPLWFYSFFHVHNLAGLSDEEWGNTKDEYLFSLDSFFQMDKVKIEKNRKLIAAVLIVLGILLLWSGVKNVLVIYLPEAVWRIISRWENTVPQMLVGVIIIFAGFHMIKGKKEELTEEINKAEIDNEKIGIGEMNNGRSGYGEDKEC